MRLGRAPDGRHRAAVHQLSGPLRGGRAELTLRRRPGQPRGSSGATSHAPLATRMRPRTFDEFVGQHRAIGAGTVLRRAIDAGEVPSLILWGPPGSGKTTLAALIAGASNATFEAVSATSAGVADLRKVVERARERLRTGRRTVLFIDEIHRFNKGSRTRCCRTSRTRPSPARRHHREPVFRGQCGAAVAKLVIRLEALETEDLRQPHHASLSDTERGLGMSMSRRRRSDRPARDPLAAVMRESRSTRSSCRSGRRAGSVGVACVTVADIEGALQNPCAPV